MSWSLVDRAMDPHLVVYHDPGSAISEQYRTFRTNLLAMNADGAPRALGVTSAIKGEGKSITAANLALALVEMPDTKALLIDADLRQPSVAALFGRPSEPGLSDLLHDGLALDQVIQPTMVPNLSVLPAGREIRNPSELLGSPRITDLVNALKAEYNYLLFDTPPVLPCADASRFRSSVGRFDPRGASRQDAARSSGAFAGKLESGAEQHPRMLFGRQPRPARSRTRVRHPRRRILIVNPVSVAPALRPWSVELEVPADKSMTQRALMLGAAAQGVTTVLSPLQSRDSLATKSALEALGVPIHDTDNGWRIEGFGDQRWPEQEVTLDLQNSGTGVRLLAGLLCGKRVSVQLVGDESLSRRPMQRIVAPLQQMGAKIQATPDGTLPLEIRPASTLRPFVGETAVASAQVKSAILLAALSASGRTALQEPKPTRDHTERMLARFGVKVEFAAGRAALMGPQSLHSTELRIPADPSSAAPWAAATAAQAGAECVLRGVLHNPRRTAFFHVLQTMGAQVEWPALPPSLDAPADVLVRGRPLRGVTVDPAQVPDMIDELPLLAILGAAATGTTVVRGAAELRVKESDRIAAMMAGLRELGVKVREFPDGFAVTGPVAFQGGQVCSQGDHRIAMAFAIAALFARDSIVIDDAASVDVSYPEFFQHLRQLTTVTALQAD